MHIPCQSTVAVAERRVLSFFEQVDPFLRTDIRSRFYLFVWNPNIYRWRQLDQPLVRSVEPVGISQLSEWSFHSERLERRHFNVAGRHYVDAPN